MTKRINVERTRRVTMLIDERPDGVHICYNRMARFLTAMKTRNLKVAKDLDAKVEAFLTSAAT